MQRPVAVSLAHRLSYISAAGAIAPKNSFIIPLRTVQTSRMGQLVSRAKKEDGSEPEPDLWMLVGLGNPGPRYEDTRHNVGFMAVDRLAQHAGVKIDRLQSNCAVGRGRVAEKKVLLVKPLTFMNVSGEGVIKLSRYYQIPAERIMVIYDDLDTPTASVRLRAKGGHGGHNGMRSIIQHLSSNEFPRIKVGIGRPSEGVPVVNYVLQDFSKGEREKIDGALGDVVQVVRAALALGMERAVSGVRVDADGNAVTPKGSHQNGKGVKEKQKKTRLGSDAEPAAGTEEESGARPQPSKDVVQGVASPATAGAP